MRYLRECQGNYANVPLRTPCGLQKVFCQDHPNGSVSTTFAPPMCHLSSQDTSAEADCSTQNLGVTCLSFWIWCCIWKDLGFSQPIRYCRPQLRISLLHGFRFFLIIRWEFYRGHWFEFSTFFLIIFNFNSSWFE